MKQFSNFLIVAMGCSVLLIGTVEIRGLQLGSRSADEWVERLERPERVENLKIDDVISRLELKPGDADHSRTSDAVDGLCRIPACGGSEAF